MIGMKATKSVPRHDVVLPVEGDERDQAVVDGFIDRNRDALNASIGRSRAEVERGVQASRSLDDIIADARRRNGQG
jgi:hypothetical protein